MSQFDIRPSANPRTAAEREAILAAPGFGKHFTDHMVTLPYSDGSWGTPTVEAYAPLSIDPSAVVLHYAQTIFEGLKAYRQADDSIASFRPEQNAARFNRSAQRLAMPTLPEELFMESLRQIVAIDRDWVPAAGGEEALYLRPFMIATETGLGVRPADEYLYSVIASPAGAYFSRGVAPVSVWLSTEYVRASPGGTGAAKFGGNYAASLRAQEQAAGEGCDQVVWLDAIERRYVEEMGGMNLFFILGTGDSAEIVTPELSGSLLPGVTRDSLIRLARHLGYPVTERKVSVEEWETGVASGEITEVFACGTAAVITPVGSVRHSGGGYTVGDGGPGEITMRLRETLTGIQRGSVDDTFGWMTTLA
ncbi:MULTISPECIES: branched-chain amino acid aminotransferase [unclassified Dietzia]|uniref:branched-chain amino acid aminotransferase n=1 Tax=unclassified Dietzia TaxID=2617939 RepID=UPI000D211C97|nr:MULTISPECIES: branched-chain amino acid aminotransferase [unclassified Dietzia]AVZ39127.1 branched chain amino acid aminotransferase [Dietzia sp. JS16-p6b]MBB1026007.1 branched-chain amino acid aminotransferase [Dietzia sp. DQ12-76]MBB1027050.1 branched-chain amino acid aminotransferase [Dietzia sp. DQ11-38-2]QGW24329.1 branched-chain amino acid aminotransferase [Dietzia sp. DQ12-45-1b]